MATVATTGRRASQTVASVGSKDAEDVSPQRLKKRATDRRCQRKAREYTKSRIAYLEGIVEDLKNHDAAAQINILNQKLKQVKAERDEIAGTLDALQTVLDPKPLPGFGDQAVSETAASGSLMNPNDTSCGIQNESMTLQEPALLPTESLVDNNTDRTLLDTFNKSGSTVIQSNSFPVDITTPIIEPDLVGPMNGIDTGHTSCSCGMHIDRQPGQLSMWQGNYWRFACEALEERFEWPEDMEPANDPDSDDVPIRALLEGWNAVRQKPLHPSWVILSRIDETLFSSMAKTDRLAILKAMHSLLQFHLRPTLECFLRLPSWYNYRPSQGLPHTYAIDFFAWPGFRERVIFNEHTYCGNIFWYLFQRNMKLLWPHSFEYCFSYDANTGMYRTNPLFDERLRDINCWTMGPDFFSHFPELRSDIPECNRIPRSVSLQKRQRKALPCATAVSPNVGEDEVDHEATTASNTVYIYGMPVSF